LLAAHGAALLVKALQLLAAGELQLTPQPEGGSRYSKPAARDFLIPTSWTARRAFNFIRGTAEWNTPYHIKGTGVDLAVREAITFAADARQEEVVLRSGRDCWIQFSPGVLHAR
jgi:methionyl-tRNA formyltransferase